MKVGILGGSGYVGGELLRLLLSHPNVEVTWITSRKYADDFVFGIHPNLRGITKLKFVSPEVSKLTDDCDLVFIALPHGASVKIVPNLIATGLRVIDMGADFRLKQPEAYEKWYGWKHPNPDLLMKAVYGLPELHRSEIRQTDLIACPGCMPTATILGLAPLVKTDLIEYDRVVVDMKMGSSGAGSKPTIASHHAEKQGSVRAYSPVNHRHLGEIEQELNLLAKNQLKVAFSAHAVNMVRGILATIHVFTTKKLQKKEIWILYRTQYEKEPFIRLVNYRKGIYRFPDPKVVTGSNYCDLGFEIDPNINRLVVLSAIDNLMKGAAGQAIQCMNINLGIDETTGLKLAGFHPL